jgi:hypothetical protein
MEGGFHSLPRQRQGCAIRPEVMAGLEALNRSRIHFLGQVIFKPEKDKGHFRVEIGGDDRALRAILPGRPR